MKRSTVPCTRRSQVLPPGCTLSILTCHAVPSCCPCPMALTPGSRLAVRGFADLEMAMPMSQGPMADIRWLGQRPRHQKHRGPRCFIAPASRLGAGRECGEQVLYETFVRFCSAFLRICEAPPPFHCHGPKHSATCATGGGGGLGAALTFGPDPPPNRGLVPTPPPPPPHPLSAQISATTKRGCRPWAGSSWGPGNRGADLLLPPPPPTEMGPDRKQAQHPPPPPHALTPSLQAVTW